MRGKIMRKIYLTTTVLSVIFAMLLISCVSIQEYEDLESRNKRTEQELEALRKEKEQTKGQIVDMENEISILKKEIEEQKVLAESEKAALKATYNSLMKSLKYEIAQGKIEVEQVRGRLTMKVTEELFFETGKADIKPQGEDVLKRIGTILKKIPEKNIRVEGHTDNVQIGPSLRAKYPTNWELGSARATNVVRFLQEKVGIDPLGLSAVSYGPYRPVASNRTDAGKAKNRRIEIILIDRDLDLAKKMRENLK
jgi:chemotaxis protein MotB